MAFPLPPASLGAASGFPLDELAETAAPAIEAEQRFSGSRSGLQLSIYAGRHGYDLQDHLESVSNRAMEPNIFFAPGFLAPAMPRLDDRQVRLTLLEQEGSPRPRVRFVMPVSVEKPGFSIGPSILRVWAHPFGPLGTPLVDASDSAETIDQVLEILSRREPGLPQVVVIPDVRLNGPFARMVRAIAIGRNLPLTSTNHYDRPMLESYDDGETYLARAISRHHLREMRRQRRQLKALGDLDYRVARQPAEIRLRMEEFLALEASGWKGQRRTAMVLDRYHAAFAREAITNLAEIDAVRIHTLTLNGRAIASMIVFIMNGEAYTWKTAYDESYRAFSPGKLLLADLTRWHLDDANIRRTDSCAHADHPIMSRFWLEREAMGTLVIGLGQNSDRDVRQAATQLHLYRNTRNMARRLREKILSLAGRA